MSDALRDALSDPGPHTAESLADRLPHFPPVVIRDALEALAAQGVLERTTRPDGAVEYRYVAPDRYAQIHMDVVKDPAKAFERKTR